MRCQTGWFAVLLLGLSATAAAQPVGEAAFPSKLVRLVIPFAPGGSADASARIVAPYLIERWKQQVIVEPRPGAATVVGTDLVAKSPPDGHTLMVNSTQFTQSLALVGKLPYDPVNDLVPITRIMRTPQVIVAHPVLPVKNIRELVALARARPGQLNMANAGNSLPTYYFNILAKIKIETIPYKGAGPMMIDVAGGHVPLAIGAVSSVQAAVRSGRVIMLGVTSRSAAFPDVPVISRDVPGYDVDTWFGVFAPRGTPRELVTRIRDDIAAIVHTPEVRKRLFDIGGDPGGDPVEEFTAQVRREIARWNEVARVSGIKPM